MTTVTRRDVEAGTREPASEQAVRAISRQTLWGLRSRWAVDVPLAVRLRVALAAGCAALAFVQHTPWVLAGALAMALTELAGGRWWAAATAVQALLAAVTVFATSAHGAAALPLLIVAAFRAGERGRLRDVGATVALTAAATAVGWSSVTPGALAGDHLVDTVQWLALAAGVGLLQAAGLRRSADSLDVLAAREAAALASQLTTLARTLPNGLHAPAVAEALLEAAVDAVPGAPLADRAAVLVRREEQVASPLAVRGSHRVPWRDPVHSQGAPARAWQTRTTVTELRAPDADGRRRGSAILCVPLLDADGELLGLLVLERLAPVPFDTDAQRRVELAAARYSPHLQAALLYGELQLVATISERERLAREMHDGIAQDLVALAFSLEIVGRELRDTSAAAEQSVRRVRDEVTRLVRDLRFSIADLRSSVRPERGLGAALSSQVQAMATATGLTMHLSLRESTFRLPAQLEAAYLRVAQAVLHDVRCDPSAHEVWLSLEVEPPGAELVVRHDGEHGHAVEPQLVEQLTRLGATVRSGVGELRVASGLPDARIPGQRSGADR